jgi:hypothetical protein
VRRNARILPKDFAIKHAFEAAKAPRMQRVCFRRPWRNQEWPSMTAERLGAVDMPISREARREKVTRLPAVDWTLYRCPDHSH